MSHSAPPVHELKIDQSFVANLAHDEDDRAIVRAIVDLAHSFGLTVVAQGVRDDASVALLRGMGTEAAQGRHFSPPRPAGEVVGWLRDRNRLPTVAPRAA